MGKRIKKLSLHKFKDINNTGFDIQEYSELKFGNNDIALKYGKELALKNIYLF